MNIFKNLEEVKEIKQIPINSIINADCLEAMTYIKDKSIDCIICDYENGLSMRSIAKKYNTNHKFIGRLLKKNKVEIRGKKETQKPKFNNKKDYLYNNMVAHLKYDVSMEWVKQYEDIEKLKFLNKSLTRERDCIGFDTELYKAFINKFYNDKQFNKIYNNWIKNKCRYLKPSLDHINPKSNGGELINLDNLQFLTWFENRAKNNLSQTEWNIIKKNIGDYLI
jgi:5-methylcytosine-specific restriction endonuclease McrA